MTQKKQQFPQLWTLQPKNGKPVPQCLAEVEDSQQSPEDGVWCMGGYEHVCRAEGEEYRQKTWKQWDKSIKLAKARGWQFVRVKLIRA